MVDKTTGAAELLCLFFTLFVLFGFPFVHIMMVIKRACLNFGVESRFPKNEKKAKKNLMEQAEEHAKGASNPEAMKSNENQNKFANYLLFL